MDKVTLTSLSDLRVRERIDRGTVKGFGEPDFIDRPATLADLRDVLEAEGAKVVEVSGHDQVYDEWAVVPVEWPGRYLVWRIEEVDSE